MTFKDLKLPQTLSRKKKLSLYKCWLKDQNDKQALTAFLDLNVDIDKYALTADAAIFDAINTSLRNEWSDKFNVIDFNIPEKVDDFISFLQKQTLVVLEVCLRASTMDEEIVILPPHSEYSTNPRYDENLLTLYATICTKITELGANRFEDMKINNYNITSVDISLDPGTELVILENMQLNKVVPNRPIPKK